MATKKRNPQDITLRNKRATNKRLDKLESEVRSLKTAVSKLKRGTLR